MPRLRAPAFVEWFAFQHASDPIAVRAPCPSRRFRCRMWKNQFKRPPFKESGCGSAQLARFFFWICYNCNAMLTDYVEAAMHKAKYKLLGGGDGFFGEIPGFRGAWANAPTLEGCREELREVLEDWM